jgi:hypothetical protein
VETAMRMLPRQYIWGDNVIWSRQRRWCQKRVKSVISLRVIIIEIMNKKELKK